MLHFKNDIRPELPFRKAMKKPISVSCIKVLSPFTVDTIEGLKQGNAGDVLMVGIKGEMWPVKHETFTKTYDIVEISEPMEGENLHFVSFEAPEVAYMRAIKKPIAIECAQVNDDFEVNGLKGKAGDYLMVGVSGEMYPCDGPIFEETYDWIE